MSIQVPGVLWPLPPTLQPMNSWDTKPCRGSGSWPQRSVELRLLVLVGKPLGQANIPCCVISFPFLGWMKLSIPHRRQIRICSLLNGPTEGQRVHGSSCKLLPQNRDPEAVALLTLPHPGPSQGSRSSTAGPSVAQQLSLIHI